MTRAAWRPTTRHPQRDSLTAMAGHPGIVLIGQAELPHQLDHEDPDRAVQLPGYQADAVHQLLDDRVLVRTDLVTVQLDDEDEPVRGCTVAPAHS